LVELKDELRASGIVIIIVVVVVDGVRHSHGDGDGISNVDDPVQLASNLCGVWYYEGVSKRWLRAADIFESKEY
jgi:hypothetical protein